MLKAGKTPEDLIKEINEAQREIKKEQADAATKAELALVKKDLVKALTSYFKVLHNGKEPDAKHIDDLINQINETEEEAKKKTTELSDDEKLRKFLDQLFVFEDTPWRI